MSADRDVTGDSELCRVVGHITIWPPESVPCAEPKVVDYLAERVSGLVGILYNVTRRLGAGSGFITHP